jgi:hypothetical protein
VKDARSIYTRNEIVGKRQALYAGAAGPRRSTEVYKGVVGTPAAAVAKGGDLRKETERVLLARYSGAGVVVDETLEVLETFGQTGPSLIRLVSAPDKGTMFQILLPCAQGTAQVSRRLRRDRPWWNSQEICCGRSIKALLRANHARLP